MTEEERKEEEEREEDNLGDLKQDVENELEDLGEDERGSSRENSFLRNLFIFLGIVVIGLVAGFFIFGEAATFEYRGVNFTIADFCDGGPCLRTYNTKIPVLYDGGIANYNFYIRNDPRDLELQVPFNGDLVLAKNMLIDVNYNRECEGYSSVAMDNFGTLMRVVGTNMTAEEGLVCSPDVEDMQVIIEEGEETKIERIGETCYVISIKECEVLRGIERFMTEVFVESKLDRPF